MSLKTSYARLRAKQALRAGARHAEAGRLEDAAGAFDRAIGFAVGHADLAGAAHRQAAIVLAELGRFAESANHLRATPPEPDGDIDLWRRLGRGLSGADEAKAALGAWGSVLSAAPDDAEALEQAAGRLKAMGRKPEAAAHLASLARISPDDPERRRDLARLHQEIDAGSEAEIAAWRDLLAAAPADREAHNRLAAIFWDAGRKAEATPHLRALTEIDPGHAKSWRRLVTCLRETGAGLEDQIQPLLGLLAAAPDDRQALNELATAYWDAGDKAKAIPYLRKVLEADPGHVKSGKRLARGLLATGDSAGAVDAWRAVLAVAPDDVEAHEDIVQILRSLGREREAIPHLEALVAGAPGRAEPRRNLARLLHDLGDDPEAQIAAWRSLLAAAPDDAEADGRLAMLLWDADRKLEALPHLRAVARANPSHLKSLKRLTLCEEAAGDVEGMIEAYKQVAALDPSDRNARWRLANLLWDANRHAEAAPFLRAVVRDQPDRVKEWTRLGRCLGVIGEDEEELAHALQDTGEAHSEISVWKQVLALNAADREASTRLAELFWEMNRKAEAAPYLRVIAQAQPKHTKTWQRLARSLDEMGEDAEAVAAWKHVLTLNSKDAEARARLSALSERV